MKDIYRKAIKVVLFVIACILIFAAIVVYKATIGGSVIWIGIIIIGGLYYFLFEWHKK